MSPVIHSRLASLGYSTSTPLVVAVVPPEAHGISSGSPETLLIPRTLRLLPGKRLVGVTDWQRQAVIIKLFYHKRRWSKHLQRELAGFELARKSGLPVPQVIASGTIAEQQGGYLLIEYLEKGVGLDSLAEQHDSRLDIGIRQALGLIARCHRQGLWQQDIHLGNFMLFNGTMYLLDSAEFKSEKPGAVLSESLRLANLALFFAQFSVYRDSRVLQLMEIYNNELADVSAVTDTALLQAQIGQARERRLDKYQSKLFRSTSDFHKEKSAGRRMLCDRRIMSDVFYRFVQNPDQFVREGTLIKDGNTTTVALVTLGDREYVLKRYNIKSPLHGLR